MRSARQVVGFAVAPLPFAIPLLLIIGGELLRAPANSGSALAAMLPLVALSYAATLLIGLPIHLLLRWTRRSNLGAYLWLTLVAVALLGCAIAVIAPLGGGNPHSLARIARSGTGLSMMLWLLALALLSASLFWTIAVRRWRS